jgi:hypothetical protein
MACQKQHLVSRKHWFAEGLLQSIGSGASSMVRDRIKGAPKLAAASRATN